MAIALENPETNPSYLDFFELSRPPFVQLSKPSQIFDTDQYSLLTDHLVSATEQPDCLVAIFGANGSGKTTLLNRYIRSLDDDVYFAAIDEKCLGEMEFYCTFLKQLGFGDITGTKGELQRITKEFLINRGMADDPVLMFIDNAHLVNPIVLEQVRRISETKVKNHRVMSIILAGNSGLENIMKSPAMSAIAFKNQVDFNIRVYTEEETTNYIDHRLKLAGDNNVVNFSKAAHSLIYKYTGGTPSLINSLCNAALTEANALESQIITKELVRTVADSRKLRPHVVALNGKGRRRIDPDYEAPQARQPAEERTIGQDPRTKESIELPPPKSALSEFDVESLLKRISSLSEQLGELKSDRKRSFEDISSRDDVINELQEQLECQTAEIDKLTSAAGSSASEITRLNQSLSDTTIALQKSENASSKLTKNLQKNQVAARIAQTDIAEAKSTVKELGIENTGLQTKILDLRSELKQAKKRVGKSGRSKKKEAAESAKSDVNIEAFEVVRDGKVEQRIEVSEGQSRIMIGRSEDSDLCLDSEFVSRHHALIFRNGEGTHVEDLNSFNGTGVNSDPITRSKLFAGDAINIGDFEIRLV